jgi:hypothetical protein
MRRRLIASATIAAAMFAGTACNSRPPATIHDQAFIKAADALCAKQLASLRAPKPDSSEADPFGGGADTKDDPAGVARKIESVSAGLDQVALALGALPLRAADQPEVASWLEEWDNFTGIGRQYAAAVRARNAKTYTSIAAEGNGPIHRIATFARANHMDHCIL